MRQSRRSTAGAKYDSPREAGVPSQAKMGDSKRKKASSGFPVDRTLDVQMARAEPRSNCVPPASKRIGQKGGGAPRCGHRAERYAWMSATAAAPSPIAPPTRLTDPDRTSPTTYTPGTLDSRAAGVNPLTV
jgi:hypothetical protein